MQYMYILVFRAIAMYPQDSLDFTSDLPPPPMPPPTPLNGLFLSTPMQQMNSLGNSSFVMKSNGPIFSQIPNAGYQFLPYGTSSSVNTGLIFQVPSHGAPLINLTGNSSNLPLPYNSGGPAQKFTSNITLNEARPSSGGSHALRSEVYVVRPSTSKAAFKNWKSSDPIENKSNEFFSRSRKDERPKSSRDELQNESSKDNRGKNSIEGNRRNPKSYAAKKERRRQNEKSRKDKANEEKRNEKPLGLKDEKRHEGLKKDGKEKEEKHKVERKNESSRKNKEEKRNAVSNKGNETARELEREERNVRVKEKTSPQKDGFEQAIVRREFELGKVSQTAKTNIPLTRTIVNDQRGSDSAQEPQLGSVIILDDDDEPTKLTRTSTTNMKQSYSWRCRKLFNGRVEIGDLPMNCSRPQTSEGRNFPASKRNQIEASPDLLNTNISNFSTTFTEKHHYLSREANIDAVNVASTSYSTSAPTSPYNPKSATRKRFANMSLRIIGGKRIYDKSNECFEFAANKTCSSGIFCLYDHDGMRNHQEKKTCFKLLKGMCRQGSSCISGEHCLEPHQIPICDYFLRILCSQPNCEFLHVKHAEGLEPCPDFNKGKCLKGVLCDRPHRYYYSIIKARGFDAMKDKESSGTNANVNTESGSDMGTFAWFV